MAEDAFAHLFTTGIPRVVTLLFRVYEIARLQRFPKIADGALTISEGLLADVNACAVEMAGLADGLIVRKMFETQSRNRPMTGNMESHVASIPGPLGSVSVAIKSELDKIINPNGYGPFWRAQEYGTGSSEVVSQVGRTFLGTFEPSGSAPDASQRGQGVGTDAAFVSGGGNAGFGTITVEDPGRHFLRDGSAEAGAEYKARMAAIQVKWADRIEALTAEATEAFTEAARVTKILRA